MTSYLLPTISMLPGSQHHCARVFVYTAMPTLAGRNPSLSTPLPAPPLLALLCPAPPLLALLPPPLTLPRRCRGVGDVDGVELQAVPIGSAGLLCREPPAALVQAGIVSPVVQDQVAATATMPVTPLHTVPLPVRRPPYARPIWSPRPPWRAVVNRTPALQFVLPAPGLSAPRCSAHTAMRPSAYLHAPCTAFFAIAMHTYARFPGARRAYLSPTMGTRHARALPPCASWRISGPHLGPLYSTLHHSVVVIR